MIVLESDKLNRRRTLNVWQVRNTEIFCMGILLKQIFVTVSSGKVCSLYLTSPKKFRMLHKICYRLSSSPGFAVTLPWQRGGRALRLWRRRAGQHAARVCRASDLHH